MSTEPNRLLPVSVWITAQKTSRYQRQGRYVPEATRHPARMLPAIAAHAIDALHPARGSGPGSDVRHRHHPGRSRRTWAGTASASSTNPNGRASPRPTSPWPPTRAPPARAGSCAATPPSSATCCPRTCTAGSRSCSPHRRTGRPCTARSNQNPATACTKATTTTDAGRDKANLANAGWHGLTTGFTQILAGCATFLRPGGYVAVTARPWRSSGQLIDLPSAVIAAGIAAGLEPVERCVALLAALRDGRLIPGRRSSNCTPSAEHARRHPAEPHRPRGRPDLPRRRTTEPRQPKQRMSALRADERRIWCCRAAGLATILGRPMDGAKSH